MNFAFLSCEFHFNEPINDFFKEYTELAAIERQIISGDYKKNSSDIVCFPSDDSRTITYYLRNPQSYKLTFGYEFNNAVTKNYAVSSPIRLTQSDDKNYLTLTIPQELLQAVDTDSKDLSGKITMYEPMSGRYFESYSVTAHANSVPPAVQNACFQLSSSDNGTYIICFYIPDVSAEAYSIHTKDTRKIYFNGKLRYFNLGKIYKNAEYSDGNWSFSNEDSDFVTTKPVGMTTSETGYDFTTSTPPVSSSAVYYKSGIAQSTETVPFEITVEDDEGLSNVVKISNSAQQLNPPVIANMTELSNGVAVDDDTGLFEIVITHDGLATDGSACGTVKIDYEVWNTNTGNIYRTGEGEGDTKIKLPKGKYKILATASKAFYIRSNYYDSSTAGEIKLTSNARFYVSETGSNTEGLGSKVYPYKTIQRAVTEFADGITRDEYLATATCEIFVMSDLTAEDEEVAGDKKLVELNSSYKYEISGYNNTKYTIDMAEKSKERFFRIENKVILKNLVFKNGHGIIVSTGGDLTLENVDFTKNSNYNGSVLYIGDGNVTYKGGKIYENTSTDPLETGTYYGAVYLKNGTGSLNVYSLSVYNNVDKNNKPSNIYIAQNKVINVKGDLSDCKLGIVSEAVPSIENPVVVTNGFGYGTTNTKKPGSIFTCDGDYGVTYNDDGEVIVALSGGSIDDIFHKYSLEIVFDESITDFTAGTSKVIPVAVKLYDNNVEVTDENALAQISGKAFMTCDGELIENTTVTFSGNTLNYTIPASVKYKYVYKLNVQAGYKDTYYNSDFTLTGK